MSCFFINFFVGREADLSENAKKQGITQKPLLANRKRKFLIFMREVHISKGKTMEAVRGARAEVGAALDVCEQHRVGAV